MKWYILQYKSVCLYCTHMCVFVSTHTCMCDRSAFALTGVWLRWSAGLLVLSCDWSAGFRTQSASPLLVLWPPRDTRHILAVESKVLCTVCRKLARWGKRKSWWEVGLGEVPLWPPALSSAVYFKNPRLPLCASRSCVYFQPCGARMWRTSHPACPESDTPVVQDTRIAASPPLLPLSARGSEMCSPHVHRGFVFLLSRSSSWPEALMPFDTSLPCVRDETCLCVCCVEK